MRVVRFDEAIRLWDFACGTCAERLQKVMGDEVRFMPSPSRWMAEGRAQMHVGVSCSPCGLVACCGPER